METDITKAELQLLAQEKILLGECLIKSLQNHAGIEGVTKIERKIQQELKFLKKVMEKQ